MHRSRRGREKVDSVLWKRLSEWIPLRVVDRLYVSGFPLNIDINE